MLSQESDILAAGNCFSQFQVASLACLQYIPKVLESVPCEYSQKLVHEFFVNALYRSVSMWLHAIPREYQHVIYTLNVYYVSRAFERQGFKFGINCVGVPILD